jgi:hypothetical protein
MAEEVASTTSPIPSYEPDDEKPSFTATEEVSSPISPISSNEPDDEKLPLTATEELVTHSMGPLSMNRTFAPLNTPMYRRRQTLTILAWFLMPWSCLYISLVLLRCHNWYIVGTFIAYLTWMVFFQKYPRTGGMKKQWLRRLTWWKWFAGKIIFFVLRFCFLIL